jgi:hypothetical protein
MAAVSSKGLLTSSVTTQTHRSRLQLPAQPLNGGNNARTQFLQSPGLHPLPQSALRPGSARQPARSRPHKRACARQRPSPYRRLVAPGRRHPHRRIPSAQRRLSVDVIDALADRAVPAPGNTAQELIIVHLDADSNHGQARGALRPGGHPASRPAPECCGKPSRM